MEKTSKLKKYFLPGLIYIVILFLISQGISLWKSRDTPSGNLSDFKIELMDGSRFAVADNSGKPVLLYFWATWCPICELQKGNVESAAKDYPVVTVATWSEGVEEATSYLKDNNPGFPVALDKSGQLSLSFGLQGVPTSFILSPNGDISFVETGYTSAVGLRFRLWLSTFTE